MAQSVVVNVQTQLDDTNIKYVNFSDSTITSAQGFYLVADPNGMTAGNWELVLSAIKAAINGNESFVDPAPQILSYEDVSTDITAGL